MGPANTARENPITDDHPSFYASIWLSEMKLEHEKYEKCVLLTSMRLAKDSSVTCMCSYLYKKLRGFKTPMKNTESFSFSNMFYFSDLIHRFET